MDDVTRKILEQIPKEELEQWLKDHGLENEVDLQEEQPKKRRQRRGSKKKEVKSKKPRTQKRGRGGERQIKKGKKKGRREEFDINEHRKMRSKGRTSGIPCSREPINVDGRNKFLGKEFATIRGAEQRAAETDRKLMKGVKHVRETREEEAYVEAKCWDCEGIFEIPASRVTEREEGTGQWLFRCLSCLEATAGDRPIEVYDD